MQLSEETIEKFITLYYNRYGTKLSESEAVEYGVRLVMFVQAVYGNDLPKRLTKEKKK